MFEILLKGGLVIDPSQGIHKKGSVAIQDGKIAAVGEDASEAEAEKVFNMEGKIIVPGLIDIHYHPAAGFSWLGAPPDEIGLNSGVTLLCDGGTSGAANFEALRLRWVQGIALPKFPPFSLLLARSSAWVTVLASAPFLASALNFSQRVATTTS